jgi:hypothetical protein
MVPMIQQVMFSKQNGYDVLISLLVKPKPRIAAMTVRQPTLTVKPSKRRRHMSPIEIDEEAPQTPRFSPVDPPDEECRPATSEPQLINSIPSSSDPHYMGSSLVPPEVSALLSPITSPTLAAGSTPLTVPSRGLADIGVDALPQVYPSVSTSLRVDTYTLDTCKFY